MESMTLLFAQTLLDLIHDKNSIFAPSKTETHLACENIRFSSLFAAGDVSARNVPSDKERGETDVFAG